MQRLAMLVTMLLVLCLQVFGGFAEEQAVSPQRAASLAALASAAVPRRTARRPTPSLWWRAR